MARGVDYDLINTPITATLCSLKVRLWCQILRRHHEGSSLFLIEIVITIPTGQFEVVSLLLLFKV